MTRPRVISPRAILVALVLVATAAGARAQAATGDSTLARVLRMASDGNGAAGRALADSVLASAKEGSPAYVDALFARASIAESGDAARKDYLRIAVEYSNSPRAEDSLLRLAQMEIARGDRAAAKQFLERLALEHSGGASRAQGAYWLGRVLIDDGALPQACASLAEAKAHVSRSDVELANQITYYSRPCVSLQRTVDSARADSIDKAVKAVRADSVARADSMAKAAAAEAKAEAAAKKKSKTSPKKESVKTAVPSSKGLAWSAQVAAYDTQEEADRLSKRLKDRGYEARVTDEKPFRVRIGRYAHREEATALVEKLKAAKMTAIVVEAEKP